MAWITKDSANAKVESRSTPYLTDAMKKTMREKHPPRYERTKGAPPVACDDPARVWLIPQQAMLEIAEFLSPAVGGDRHRLLL